MHPNPMEIKRVKVERREMDLREEAKALEGFRAQYPEGQLVTVTVGNHESTIYAAHLQPAKMRGFCGTIAPGWIVPYGFLTKPDWVRVYSLSHLLHDFERITVEQFMQAIDLPEKQAIRDRLLKRRE